MSKSSGVSLALFIAVLSSATPAAADGMLDPSFGNGGLVTTNFPFPFSSDYASAVIVLQDGRAVAAGGVGDVDGHAMGAARYLTSGALDTTFGSDGRAIVGGCPSIGAGGGAQAILPQPDERLVLVGECPGGLFLSVARLNVNGTLDTSFGTGGQVITPFPPDGAFAAAGVLQPDGRIVAVGYSAFCCTQTDLKAARYNPDGSLDPSFGTGGTLALDLGQDFIPGDAVLQADGKLVIAGRFGPTGGSDFGLVRLLPNGTLDPSFDGDGVVISDFGADEAGASVILLGDGRIVLGGSRSSDLALARYRPDGLLDVTFGTGGLATADSGAPDGLGQLILLPNGKLLAGATVSQGSYDFLLARFHPDGALDTSFGSSGFIKTDFNAGSSDGCSAVTLAGPDLVLAAGTTSGAADFGDFALARYIASTPVELLGFEVQ
jgi:uncharacterized delta-60 repeat protein